MKLDENNLKDKDNSTFFSNNEIDYMFRQNVELLFVYVNNYKVFKNPQKINLNSKYLFDYNELKNEIIIKNNPEYVKIFPDSINLKIICGENGTGKTTLMRLIQGKEYNLPSDFFVLLKDDCGNYYANNANLKIIDKIQKKKIILDKRFKKWTHIDLSYLSFQYDEPFEVGKIYIQNKFKIDKLFCKELFDSYYIVYRDFNNNIDEITKKIKETFDNYIEEIENSLYKIEHYLKFHPFHYVVLYNLCCNNLFDKFNYLLNRIQGNKKFSDAIEIMDFIVNTYFKNTKINIENMNTKLLKFLYNDKYIKFQNQELGCLFNKNNDGSFSMKKYNGAKNVIFSIIDNKIYPPGFKKIMKNIGELIKQSKFCLGHCVSLRMLDDLLFMPIPINTCEKFEYMDLSAGEKEKLQLAGWLVKKMCYIENNSILLEDDVCICAHPNWSKNFLYDYINLLVELKKMIKQEDKTTNIIITTHSPFILSDVSKLNIEYLKKDEQNRTLNKETFAGNIGEMFNETFFMSSTIGKYSEELIKDIIKYINKEETKFKIIKDDKSCEKIINSIGDRILRILLLEKFENRNQNNETNKNN